MFGLFKNKPSLTEYAEAAEILPVVENGDYKAFLIQVQDSARNFGSIVMKAGGNSAMGEFVSIIERRIGSNDFENPFYSMFSGPADEPQARNLNVERVVVCRGESGYVFKWNP